MKKRSAQVKRSLKVEGRGGCEAESDKYGFARRLRTFHGVWCLCLVVY